MSNKLPSAFLRRLIEEHKIEEKPFIDKHDSGEQITSVRLNPHKPVHKFQFAPQVPWCPSGRYLPERPSFIADPSFHAGCYYVQEASSMFLEQALKHTADLGESLRVLDLCAAPGGKSTLIASLINKDSLLVANEIIKSRVGVLTENLSKWGNVNVVVSNNDPKDFRRLECYFDVMVIDAPCSGSGMFRKDPAAIEEWSESNVQLCSERQQRILADAYPALKEDGILIYSTCSYSTEENEHIADWLMDSYKLQSLRIPTEQSWGITETRSEVHGCFGYRFYPHRTKGEGFFLTCFRKQDGAARAGVSGGKPARASKLAPRDLEVIKPWLKGDDFSIIPVKDGYSVIPASISSDVRFLESKLYLKKSGSFIGKIMGKDLIPDHELALSSALSGEIRRIELNSEQALSYLRKDEIKLEAQTPGWALMCFEGQGLGWAKVLQNRVNNYYPKGLRILKEF